MSYVFRKIKKYTINLLEIFAFNSYYNWISIAILVLTWTGLFGAATVYLSGFITLSWIVGWLYEIHKLTKENEFLRTVNASLTYRSTKDLREGLAALMHDIWAEDILQTYASPSQEYRANTPYYDLTEDDKLVNLAKADRVLDLISSYKKDNN